MRLDEFREKVRNYRRAVDRSQEELAFEIGLNPSVLSDKLNGKPTAAPFSRSQVKSLVKTLANWQAITRRSEAVALLNLLEIPAETVGRDEWQSAPLNRLVEDLPIEPAAVRAYHKEETPLPQGTLTFLVMGITGNTRLREENGREMDGLLQINQEILEKTIEQHKGYIFKTGGEACWAVFSEAHQAVSAAFQAQNLLKTGLRYAANNSGVDFKLRMALHTGSAQSSGRAYFGPVLDRVSQILGAAAGGQIFLSHITAHLVSGELPKGVELSGIGLYHLTGSAQPEELYRLVFREVSTESNIFSHHENNLYSLPLQATTFIGREQELNQITGLLRNPEVRLLTLTGPAGTGKTRLCLEVAHRLKSVYSAEIIFVPLAPINNADLVVTAIAGACGVKDNPGQSTETALLHFLRNKAYLLILDNFEHVIAAAPVVDTFLKSSPKLKVLVTSREVLHLYGEREYQVPPLKLAVLDSLPPVEELLNYEAIKLFVDRAQATRPVFQLTSDNAATIAEICQKLDGLPLALELAAARIKLFSPQALLTRLDKRLRVLTGELKNITPRQKTLQGAIDWSYNLLYEAEKKLFRQLGVFTGGFAIEAVEAICETPGIDNLTLLASLVDKSLVQPEDLSGTIQTGEGRFRLLETLKEYAFVCLEQNGELKEMRRKHAEYYSARAIEAGRGVKTSRQYYWLSWLSQEKDNLRCAFLWSLEEAENPTPVEDGRENGFIIGAGFAGMLGWYWAFYGYMEGRHWLEALLQAYQKYNPVPIEADTRYKAVIARLYYSLSQVLMNSGQYQRAIELGKQALQMQREAGNELEVGLVLTQLGSIAWYMSDIEQLSRYAGEALMLGQKLNDPWLEAYSLFLKGTEAKFKGSFIEARDLLEKSQAKFKESGDRVDTTIPLCHLGALANELEDWENSQRLLEECSRISLEVNNKWMSSVVRLFLADGFLTQGRISEALRVIEENLEYIRQIQDDWSMAYICFQKARVYLSQGDYRAALVECQASLVLRRKLGNQKDILESERLLSLINRAETPLTE